MNSCSKANNIKCFLQRNLIKSRGGSRLLKRGGTARPVIIGDVGLACIFTLIMCEAHRHAKHASTRGFGGIPPRKF